MHTSTLTRCSRRGNSQLPKLLVRVPTVPQQGTLKKYGLTVGEWLQIAKRQGNVCAVCKKLPDNGRLCTDHEHVYGWKAMPPEKRKQYVRGLLCYFCNHYYMGRAINIFKAENVAIFLRKYDARKNSPEVQKILGESKRRKNSG